MAGQHRDDPISLKNETVVPLCTRRAFKPSHSILCAWLAVQSAVLTPSVLQQAMFLRWQRRTIQLVYVHVCSLGLLGFGGTGASSWIMPFAAQPRAGLWRRLRFTETRRHDAFGTPGSVAGGTRSRSQSLRASQTGSAPVDGPRSVAATPSYRFGDFRACAIVRACCFGHKHRRVAQTRLALRKCVVATAANTK